MRRVAYLSLIVTLVFQLSGDAYQKKNLPRKLPGGSAESGFLLPNGWSLTPAGEQIDVGDLPLALLLHPDGKHLLVANNGYSTQSVDVINLDSKKIVSRARVEMAWLGLAVSRDGTTVYAGGGMSNTILRFSFTSGRIASIPAITVGGRKADVYPGGLCVAGSRLYVANNLSNDVAAVDLQTGTVLWRAEVGNHPYTCTVAPDGRTVYVSVWGAAQVAVVDTASMRVTARIPTDDHPNALAFSADSRRLFVANANSNTISAIDLETHKVQERISVALYPDSPAGSTTNALAVSPDGTRLYAANADNNDVAVINIASRGESRVLGFIPAGWYPTALAVSPDGKTLYVANGKGSRSFPNPKGPQPTQERTADTQYIGQLMMGSVSVVPIPDGASLRRYTAQVYKNTPYSEKKRLSVPAQGASAVPARVGATSPIRHVIYIIKENRTYDQVFGDIAEGNGDSSLTLFGEEVTPNHHALAREFVLLDNFYADAEVSADGHNWSMGAYATDYVEKTWPSQYSSRRRTYDYEGGTPIAAPSAGYIWDACKRGGISYRSYGEWVVNGAGPRGISVARPGALEGHIDPQYRGFDLAYSDLDRAQRFLDELKRFESEGAMPRFQVVRLGNDHTQGTRAGSLTPRAFVAQNDRALGRLVEGVSHSRFWSSTAILVIEDDAQNGPDHVDSHRTVAFAISPYVKRKTVDSTMYSSTSMLRTIELILGLPPMSQYDAAATPMFTSFGTEADPTPYNARAARVSLTETNPPDAPGAKRSMEMNFKDADSAPDIEFNEIIWKSIKGKDSTMPAPVRSVFCRSRR
ncbi:MAG: bifunctional YncE family protein/alkaline phosphatase family protein [Acidobacteriia bacterium]|nr:bifunctional YncE family protein/alkaline phosphatase family protein [Terriglobia bacterium]